jgi:hypothetical protein
MSDNLPQPPRPPTPTDVQDWLCYQHEDLTRRCDELIPPLQAIIDLYEDGIDGEPANQTAAENTRMAKALVAAADTARKADKEPYLHAGRAVDTWFRLLLEPLLEPLNKLEAMISDYLLAKEAKARAIGQTGKTSDLVRTTGIYGATATLQTRIGFKVIDQAAVPEEFKEIVSTRVRAVMADRDPKTGWPRRTITGIEWVELKSARIA